MNNEGVKHNISKIEKITPEICPILPPHKKNDFVIPLSKSRVPQTIENQQTQFNGGSQKRNGLSLVLWMWTAAVIDYLIIAFLCIVALIVFSQIAKTYALDVIHFLLLNKNVAKTILGLLVISGWMYFIVVRVFIGASIGEWTCGLRCGRPLERLKKRYVLRLLVRTTVVLISGVIVVPLLSLVFRRDLAGKISGGLYIYALK